MIARLQSAGVDTSRIMRTDAPTSVAISLVNQAGERALLYQLGASAETFPAFPISGASHFHLAAVFRMNHLRTAAPEVLRRAKELGMTTSVDTQWDTEDQWMKVLGPSLPSTDLLFVNEDEARMLTGSGDIDAGGAYAALGGRENSLHQARAAGLSGVLRRGEFHRRRDSA